MEQNQAAQFWMMMKRKQMMMKTRVNQVPTTLMKMKPTVYDHDTWEEKAFAEDAAGPLGGCIWPPKSYSCSFCRREFRSAQALGGHMNVHRRDRARLKQSLSPQNDQDHHDHSSNNAPICNSTSLFASSTSCLRANLDEYVKNDDRVDTDLSMGLSLVVRRDGDEVISCKRHKSFTTLKFPFSVVKPCFSEVGSVEELDLELRLGDAPEVK